MTRPAHDPLTDQKVQALRPGSMPIDVRDGLMRGLILTILPNGRKQFTVRYRVAGKQRRLVLGEYPGLTLAKARKRARKELTAVDEGKDPAGARQAARKAPTDTVKALAADFLAKHVHKLRGAAEVERILDADVLPVWGSKSVKGLTRRDVRALLDRVTKRGSPIAANRLLAVVRKMLAFGVSEDWLDASPASHVEKPGVEKSRDRVLTDDEIRRLWRCLEHFPTTAEKQAPGRKRAKGTKADPLCPISPALAAVQKIRLLTAQRGGEVLGMEWSELDLAAGWWTIPGTRTKNAEAHRVFLTTPTIAIIEAQRKDQKPDAVSVFMGTGASLKDRAKKAPAALAEVLGFDFRGHDLRRTAATRMAAAGIPREHIGKVLNHVEGGARATRVYDRHSYDHEKQIALETWARVLDGILSGTDTANVLPMTKRA